MRFGLFICLTSILLVPLIGQGAPPKQSGDVTVQGSGPEGAASDGANEAESLPTFSFKNLRYDEDYSYLDKSTREYRSDFFDPIKNIHIAEDWRLSLGGEFKFRLESQTNFAFDANRRTQDTFQLYRWMLHTDLKYRDLFRVFLQGASIHEEDRDLGIRVIDENRLALQQLFFDFKPLGDETPLTVRIGRQDLQYGKQHFVSPLEWSNTRRRFDAAKLFWEADSWQLDFFYAKPVPVQRTRFDDYDEEFDFYGIYYTYSGIRDHMIDLFFFAVDDTRNRTNPNGNAGDVTRFTLGGMFSGKAAGFDYLAMLAGQWGTWAGDNIEAWAWSLDGGYTFGDVAWKPRIGLGFDWASGDRDAFDGSVETFDQLFPLGHAYLGFMDFFARQNVQALNANLTLWPVAERVRFRATYHAFWLESRDDAIYSAGGAAGRRDPMGNSGRNAGSEIDLTLLWKVDAHSAFLLGYSHFFEGEFIQETGPSSDADFFYIQYQFKF